MREGVFSVIGCHLIPIGNKIDKSTIMGLNIKTANQRSNACISDPSIIININAVQAITSYGGDLQDLLHGER